MPPTLTCFNNPLSTTHATSTSHPRGLARAHPQRWFKVHCFGSETWPYPPYTAQSLLTSRTKGPLRGEGSEYVQNGQAKGLNATLVFRF